MERRQDLKEKARHSKRLLDNPGPIECGDHGRLSPAGRGPTVRRHWVSARSKMKEVDAGGERQPLAMAHRLMS
ncbi:uncharacterized protein ACA1_389710 [Acanthamoeba castellanii str. Neff]|uniref:Uncharacterized protein n=1 Tax=Acanthamoeba castellanii (strain ATCC 30010 / Neff) TaxID=1257118 RepID=L8GDQ6_ACACF|nr:uncharacterized protein ACA1_389710 [Acanthamoeba castellanii str. Neff]ELR11250.1 hypothetical protein ACA1_389710 [Acanthamoeba castellanii str. Neff]